jgi:hypothetical protein
MNSLEASELRGSTVLRFSILHSNFEIRNSLFRHSRLAPPSPKTKSARDLSRADSNERQKRI